MAYSDKKLADEMQKEMYIIPGSRPFVRVYMKGYPPKSDYLKEFYDENIGFMNNVVEGAPQGAYFATVGKDIVSTEFEGETTGVRRGTVNITDPLAVWPEIMANISMFINGRGRGLPSILIQYGWMGLGLGQGDNIKELMAIIRETNFSIDENGVMNLTLHFVEDSIDRVRSLRFARFEDMYSTDPSTAEEAGAVGATRSSSNRYMSGGIAGGIPPGIGETESSGEPNFDVSTVDGLINHMTEHTSIKEQLERYHIFINFEETDDSVNVDLKDYTVRIGDSYISKVNKLISDAKKPDGDYTKWDYRYHIKRKKIEPSDSDKSNFETYIKYGWTATPRPDNDEDKEVKAKTMFDNSQHIGYLIWRVDPESETDSKNPKANVDSSLGGKYNKIALSVDIDLKMFDHLHALLNDEVSETVSKFDDKPWEFFSEDIKEHFDGGGREGDVMTDLELTRDRWFEGGRGRERSDEFRDREKLWEELKEQYKKLRETEKGGVSSQIQSLISQFAFQAKVVILGDPAFGTTIEPYSAYFISNFETLGEFSSYLSGLPWVFKKATHKIDAEGTYKTELELQTIPVMPASEEPKYSKSKAEHNLTR